MKIFCLIVLLTVSYRGFAQQDQFLIITYEIDRNKDMHGTFVYFWTTPIDSVNDNGLDLLPVYIHDFYSSDSYSKCCHGDSIDFIIATTETRYDFNEDYLQQKEYLFDLVDDNRILIQTIKKRWEKGYKETIRVFATPVLGQFCYCQVFGRSLNSTNEREAIYLPNKGFKILNNFWTTEKGSIAKYWDYSRINPENSEYRTPK